jgi:hypothetical protein
MNKYPVLKNILSAFAILVSIPVLLTLLFLFYALISSIYGRIIPWTQGVGPNPYFILRPITLFVILAVLSWLIFRSKLATLYKAIFTTLPVATVLVFIAIYFNEYPVFVYSLGAFISLGVLAYLFLTKKPWLYYFSVIIVSLVMLVIGLSGVDI